MIGKVATKLYTGVGLLMAQKSSAELKDTYILSVCIQFPAVASGYV